MSVLATSTWLSRTRPRLARIDSRSAARASPPTATRRSSAGSDRPSRPRSSCASSNVAGTPQSVSDQPGDMDVVWRGTANSKLYDLAYRNQIVAAQPRRPSRAAATWPPTPALVSPTAGTDRRVLGGQPRAISGRCSRRPGSSERRRGSTPQQLKVGSLALVSAPAAVSQAPGQIEVFWKATDSTLWSEIIQRRLVGADATQQRPRRRQPRARSPPPTAPSRVVWRDTAGNLWTDLGSAYGWFGAHEVGTGGLASDPTVAASGPGTVDAVWRTQAGSVWAAVVTPNGGPAQVEVNSAVSMGRPAAAGTAASAVTVVMQRTERQPRSRDLQPRQRMDRTAAAQPGRRRLAALGGELVRQRRCGVLAGKRRQPLVVGRVRRLRRTPAAGLQRPDPVASGGGCRDALAAAGAMIRGVTTLAELARAGDAIAKTSSKLGEGAPAGASSSPRLTEAELAHGARYFGGGVFPAGDERTLQVGGAAFSTVLRDVSGADDAAIRAAWRRHSDAGDVTGDLLRASKVATPTRSRSATSTSAFADDRRRARRARARQRCSPRSSSVRARTRLATSPS